ncbi:hypothetical protein [Azotobacter beijerinckii]|uniref:Uncharacterized protein n=1 Tax=Azotobacter beijerinckii TaxID=170623 RepID=A0A1I4FE34_9GAMM|nr:hypothetical protein [Azotobacter beijerinckii]SFB65267.1 hypothetical protein SAMN04244571_04796 [Azotobacter beijerinckii]SFL15137.1 hypothetical protein SAMN04244574_03301 [Azotobacter beijerinckii]
MAFDIEEVLDGMLDAAAGVLSAEWPKVRACVKTALEEERDALEAIAKARLNGEIDDDEMNSQLKDEKETLKAALLVCKVKGKIAAQKAANAAIKVLSDAIKAALKAL